MFNEVVTGALDRIKGSPLGQLMRTVDEYGQVNWEMVKVLATIMPAVLVAFTEGAFKKVTQTSWRFEPEMLVYCCAQNLGRQNMKRGQRGVGSYDILLSVLDLFAGQDLGLGITPFEPVSMEIMTSEDMEKEGISIYALRFRTGWTVRRVDDDEGIYMERVGIQYFLKPGDDVADAEDQVTLS